jgi:general stress protein 26
MGNNQKIEKFKKLVNDIKFAMFATVCSEDGSICSRPMTLQQIDENEEMWFFAGKDSDLVSDIAENPQVNIIFSHPGESSYVSVVGQAITVDNLAKTKELYGPTVKAWFPDGPEDKNMALIKCRVECVDYWDSPSSKAVQLYAFAKSIVSGERPGDDLGGHKHVDVRNN